MLLKNAIQKVHVYAYDSTTGAAKTGDAANITGYVSLDGTANAIDDTNPAEVDATNLPGVYVFDLTAAETNCDAWALYAKSSTANIRFEPIIGFTTAGTAASISANATAINGVSTSNVTAILASVGTAATSTAQTGDAYARLGAPAGGSVSADVAALKAETVAILEDTAVIGALGAGLTALPQLPTLALTTGHAHAGGTASSFGTSLTHADNVWNDALILFTSGDLVGQVKEIGDFANTGGVITLTSGQAFTAAPADNDTFTLINR